MTGWQDAALVDLRQHYPEGAWRVDPILRRLKLPRAECWLVGRLTPSAQPTVIVRVDRNESDGGWYRATVRVADAKPVEGMDPTSAARAVRSALARTVVPS